MVAILSLFFLSGISGLVYQIVWVRLLTHLLGGSSLAISTVLAVFMAGLALGSRLFGARVDAEPRPLRIYAVLEIGVAFFGLLVPFLVVAIQPLYVTTARALPPDLWILPRLAVAVLLLLPPTIFMGGTLPVLGRYLVRREEALGRRLGTLYAVNMAGAVLGAFASGFLLVEALGLVGATIAAAAGNLVAAFVTFAIDRRVEPLAASPPAAPTRRAPAPVAPRLLAIVFGASGCAALGYEIYWTRALQLFLGNTTYAFSAMLTTFLVGLAGGSWAGGHLADRWRDRSALLAWLQISIGATALASVPLLWSWLPSLQESAFLDGRHLRWTEYVLRRFGVAFAVMAPTTFLIGMTFPIVTRIGIRDVGRVGDGVGSLYFANTVGAILGSLAAGFLVLPWLGAKGAIVATALGNVAIGLVVLVGSTPRPRAHLLAGCVAAAALVGLGSRLPGAGTTILSMSQAPEDRVLFDREDSFAQTRVYEKPSGERHMSVNGHHIGGTEPNLLRKEKILAHLPMALVPAARNVLSIGLGSGITLGAFARYDEIERITCVEIAPAVVEGASLFAAHHGDVLKAANVRLRVEDGIQFLLTTTDRYDVISSDSKLNPSFVGNAPLLARDYYELCRDRLSDEGVLVQWLPAHVPPEELRTIVRGMVHAFPHSAVFWYDPASVVMAGARREVTLFMDRVRAFLDDDRIRPDLASLHLDDPHVLASLFVAGDDLLARSVGDGPVTTWRRPRVEFTMIRSTLEGSMPAREDANLRWLADIRRPELLALHGAHDERALQRFRASTTKLLRGFAAGGGVARLDTGATYFREGLEANPDDRRLALVLDYLAATTSGRK